MIEVQVDMSNAVRAAARVLLGAALDLIQVDPHQWSTRPCSTCKAVTAIVGREFGCDLLRLQRKEREG